MEVGVQMCKTLGHHVNDHAILPHGNQIGGIMTKKDVEELKSEYTQPDLGVHSRFSVRFRNG